MLRLPHLLLAAPLALAACASLSGSSDSATVLSHDVFFTLNDRSPEAVQTLVDACHERLGDLPGIVYFTAGAREASLDREVNDLDFDVALHVVFEDLAAHDAYAEAPEHLRFIDENRDSWAGVRVFDSTVTGGAR